MDNNIQITDLTDHQVQLLLLIQLASNGVDAKAMTSRNLRFSAASKTLVQIGYLDVTNDSAVATPIAIEYLISNGYIDDNGELTVVGTDAHRSATLALNEGEGFTLLRSIV